jgi:hypothetical protein
VLGEPLVPPSTEPTPGEIGFDERVVAPASPDPAALPLPEVPPDLVDGQSAAVLLLGPVDPGAVPPEMPLPLVSPPRTAISGQSTALPAAEVPGVCVPPVEPGAPAEGPPRSETPVELPAPELCAPGTAGSTVPGRFELMPGDPLVDD